MIPLRYHDKYVRLPEPVPRWFCERLYLSSAAANVIATLTIPYDYDLFMQSYLGNARGGGAQTISNFGFYYTRPPDTLQLYVDYVERPTPVTVEQFRNATDIIIPAGAVLKAEGNFSAAALANIVSVYIHGVYVPRMEFLT